MEKQTKFEADLQAYFPDIYALHQLGKSDVHLWDVVGFMLQMRAEDATGVLKISYTRGAIDSCRKDQDMLAFKSKRPGY